MRSIECDAGETPFARLEASAGELGRGLRSGDEGEPQRDLCGRKPGRTVRGGFTLRKPSLGAVGKVHVSEEGEERGPEGARPHGAVARPADRGLGAGFEGAGVWQVMFAGTTRMRERCRQPELLEPGFREEAGGFRVVLLETLRPGDLVGRGFLERIGTPVRGTRYAARKAQKPQ
jgi:hypothetical protein